MRSAILLCCLLVEAPDRRRLAAYNYMQVAKLTAADAAAGDWFGSSVAIDGDTVVVGAYHKEAAYVFRTTDGGATYGQVAKLTASDFAAGDPFDGAVAIAGGTVVAGAWNLNGGAAYVYRTTDGGGTYPQVAKLSSDCVNVFYPSQPCSGDAFGASVAISESGDTIVAGAWGHNDAKLDDAGVYSASTDMGSAYVLRTTDDWSTHTLTKLTATDAVESDHFGESVAIHSSLVVVGAPHHDDADWDSGAVYVFRTEDGGASFGAVATGASAACACLGSAAAASPAPRAGRGGPPGPWR